MPLGGLASSEQPPLVPPAVDRQQKLPTRSTRKKSKEKKLQTHSADFGSHARAGPDPDGGRGSGRKGAGPCNHRVPLLP